MEVVVKVKTILKIVLGVIGALLLLIVLTVLFWLGPTVKLIAGNIGSKALGTPLTIDKLSINPRKGLIHLSDFSIANPESYGQSNAVSLAGLDISIDMGSVFTKTVVVHRVEINSPHFTYEQDSASDNIQDFIRNIQAYAGIDPAAPPPPPNPKNLKEERRKQNEKIRQLKEESPKVVVVEALNINDVRMHLANTTDPQLDFELGFDRLAVSTTNGNIRLDNVRVSNPGRLKTPDLFALEGVEIQLDPESLFSSNIVVQSVDVRRPHLYAEHNPETDTLWEFLKIAEGIASEIPTNAPAAATNELVIAGLEPLEPPPPPPTVQLGPITVDDVQFHVVNIGDPKLSIQLGLKQLTVALERGTVDLSNLFISNPKQLATPNLFSLESIHVDLDPDSLNGAVPVIRDVQVRRPYLFLEQNKESDTVSEFMKIADGFIERLPAYPMPAAPQTAGGTQTESAPATPRNAAPPLELQNLSVDDIQVKLLDTTSTNQVPDTPHMLAGIGQISARLIEGQVQIKGITVPNVPGFLATNLFHLAGIDVRIDPESLFSDQVVIHKVLVDSPEVNLEQTEESGNVAELETQLMRFVPPTAPTVEAQPVETAEEKPEPVALSELPVVLGQLQVTNLNINLKLPVNTNEPPWAVSMTDLGKLNPLDKLSFDKLNPLSGGDKEEPEPDPDAPMTLVAFRNLSLEPLKGLLTINDLRVANPPDFSHRDLVGIDEFRLDLDPDTLQADTLLIEDLVITRPKVRFERQIMTDNVKALQKEIEKATTRRGQFTADTEKQEVPEAEEEEGQKVVLEHVLITKSTVQAKLSALPATPPIPLPKIELHDIGKEKGGTSAAQASREVFDTFYDEMIGAVGNTTGFAGDVLKGGGALSLQALGIGGKKEKAAVEEEEKEAPVRTEKKKRRRRIGGRPF